MSGLVDVVLEAGGYAKWRRLTDRLYDHVYQPHYEDETWTGLPLVHVVDDFARKIGVTLRNRQPRLPIPADLRERLRPQVEALRRSGPIIAAQIGPSWAVRTWPQEHWDGVWSAGWRRSATPSSILLGADFHLEARKCASAAGRVPGAVDWINQSSLPETAAVLSLCDGFVGIDSALLHMAGAVGTPCRRPVRPRGPGPAARPRPHPPSPSRPPASPAWAATTASLVSTGRPGCPHDIACMRGISPDAVFEAVISLLRCEEPS